MTILSFTDARRAVEEHARAVRKTQVDQVDLFEAAGRVIAQNVSADRDLPPFRRATRDGFAVRTEDVTNVPKKLRITAEIAAGADITGIAVGAGQCAEIMTGAAVPNGADAVVMVEYTARDGDVVEIQRATAADENIVPRGAEARQGQVLLMAGSRFTPAAIAVAASVGLAEVNVFSRPNVAILATGDELVEIQARPSSHEIRNSNTYSLAAQVSSVGATAIALPIAPDQKAKLRQLIESGLNSDLLLLTGGVSMGKYDLVETVLEELSAEFIFTGARIQPGKPIVFGKVKWQDETKYFFGLPGNPVSTMVTFELFVRPMIEALSGAAITPLRYAKARLKAEVKTKTGLTRFLPAQLAGEFDDVTIELARWQGSGDMVSTSAANALLVIPSDRECLQIGESVSYLPL